MARLRLSPVLLVYAVLSIGCESAPTPEPTFTIRDSAGIEIVESSAPLLGPDAWRISEEPVLQIGKVEGEDPYLFGDLSSGGFNWGKIFRMEDHRIVVCDDLDRTIRIFDEEGTFIKQMGGAGEGPGEFQSIWACTRTGSGFAVIGYPGKAAWFNTNGDLLRSFRATNVSDGRTDLWGVFEDGSSFVTTYPSDVSGLGAGVHTRTREVLIVSEDGAVANDVLTVNDGNHASDGTNGITQHFGPRGEWLVVGNRFAYGWPDKYEIGIYDKTGTPLKTIRRGWDLEPVTEDDKREWASYRMEIDALQGREDTPARRRGRQSQIDRMIHPEYHAIFDRLLVDQTGHLWVRHKHPRMEYVFSNHILRFPYDLTWDVFDPSGQWVTSVAFPGSLDIHDIGEDYILGVWKDELDVEYVRMYSLDRGD